MFHPKFVIHKLVHTNSVFISYKNVCLVISWSCRLARANAELWQTSFEDITDGGGGKQTSTGIVDEIDHMGTQKTGTGVKEKKKKGKSVKGTETEKHEKSIENKRNAGTEKKGTDNKKQENRGKEVKAADGNEEGAFLSLVNQAKTGLIQKRTIAVNYDSDDSIAIFEETKQRLKSFTKTADTKRRKSVTFKKNDLSVHESKGKKSKSEIKLKKTKSQKGRKSVNSLVQQNVSKSESKLKSKGRKQKSESPDEDKDDNEEIEKFENVYDIDTAANVDEFNNFSLSAMDKSVGNKSTRSTRNKKTQKATSQGKGSGNRGPGRNKGVVENIMSDVGIKKRRLSFSASQDGCDQDMVKSDITEHGTKKTGRQSGIQAARSVKRKSSSEEEEGTSTETKRSRRHSGQKSDEELEKKKSISKKLKTNKTLNGTLEEENGNRKILKSKSSNKSLNQSKQLALEKKKKKKMSAILPPGAVHVDTSIEQAGEDNVGDATYVPVAFSTPGVSNSRSGTLGFS